MTWLTLIGGVAIGFALGFLLKAFLDVARIRAAERKHRGLLDDARLAETNKAYYKDRSKKAEMQVAALIAAQGKEDEIKSLEGDRLNDRLNSMLDGLCSETDPDCPE